jgi:hypothetical protein
MARAEVMESKYGVFSDISFSFYDCTVLGLVDFAVGIVLLARLFVQESNQPYVLPSSGLAGFVSN